MEKKDDEKNYLRRKENKLVKLNKTKLFFQESCDYSW